MGMSKSVASKAFHLAVKAKHDHFHGKNPCMVCWEFFCSMDWATWMDNGHDPNKHPCRTKQQLDADVTRTCDAWTAS